MKTNKAVMLCIARAVGIPFILTTTVLPAAAFENAPGEVFRQFYGPLLPVRAEAGRAGYLSAQDGVSTGDGGWLICWTESGLDLQSRLMVRLLPPAFDRPSFPVPAGWADTAGPRPTVVASGAGVSGFLIAGSGGALLVWTGNGADRAQWYSQEEGGPVGAAVSLEAGPWEGSGSGGKYWLVSNRNAAESDSGVVLQQSGNGVVLTRRFTLDRTLFPYRQICAGSECCLVSSLFYGPLDSVYVRTATVDSAGRISSPVEMPLPARAVWLGAMASGSGFYGVWLVPYATGAMIEGRAMGADGAWASGSVVVPMGPAGLGNVGAQLKPGPGAAVLLPPGSPRPDPVLVRPGQPLQLLEPGHPEDVHITDGTRLLSLQRTGANRLQVRRILLDYDPAQPPFTAGISSGAGNQLAPAVAWTTAGPHMVFQVEGYGEQNAQEITGGSKPAYGTVGTRFFTGSFSSPAQAWRGNLQLVAWRSTTDGTDGPDDVYGQLVSVAADGTATTVRGPFLIAGGPGSQRAVAVSPLYSTDGFTVVWRHELYAPDGTYTSEIRSATISAAGVMSPPAGRLVDISLGELSAPDVDQYDIVYRVQSPPGSETTVIRRAVFAGGGTRWTDLSPAAHDAVNPRVLAQGQFRAVVWRDRIKKQIHLYREGGNPPLIAVSPATHRAREPRLAYLSANYFAVLWLEEHPGATTRVWMALANNQTLGEPIPLVEGWLDRDTLSVSGDGQGRIVVAVSEISTGSPGLKVLVVAPFSRQQGGLAIAPSGRGLEVSWDYDPVTFPPAAATLETSRDLREWQPLSGTPPVIQPGGRVSYQLLRQETEAHRYYRLRATLTGP